MTTATAERAEAVDAAPAWTPAARAEDALGELVDAAVHARRIEAMQAAIRVDVLNLAVACAMDNAAAFTASTLSAERRRELARRAVIAELATALRVPERTMMRWVSDAWALANRLPATLAALRAGQLDEAHARVIIEETTDLDPEALARLDGALAARAETLTAAGLRRVARWLREEVLAQTLTDRHAAARAERRIELEPARDGMAWLHLHLAAADALLIRDRIGRIAADATTPSRPATGEVLDPSDPAVADPIGADPRTPDQVRADVARDRRATGRRGVPRRRRHDPTHRARDRPRAHPARRGCAGRTRRVRADRPRHRPRTRRTRPLVREAAHAPHHRLSTRRGPHDLSPARRSRTLASGAGPDLPVPRLRARRRPLRPRPHPELVRRSRPNRIRQPRPPLPRPPPPQTRDHLDRPTPPRRHPRMALPHRTTPHHRTRRAHPDPSGCTTPATSTASGGRTTERRRRNRNHCRRLTAVLTAILLESCRESGPEATERCAVRHTVTRARNGE